MKNLINLISLQFAVLLVAILGLSGFVSTANAQSSETHFLFQEMNSSNGSPVGISPESFVDYKDLWAFNGTNYVSSVFNNGPDDIIVFDKIIVDETTLIYGISNGDELCYTADNGENWTVIYSGSFPLNISPHDMTCVYKDETFHWFPMTGSNLFYINGNILESRLDFGDCNSVCSNGTDTIYIARGSFSDRAYSVIDWDNYVDLGNGLSSIDWKNNKLISITASKVKMRSTNPSDTWETIINLNPSDYWQYCTWLDDGIAIGSNVTKVIQVWREIVAPNPEFSGDELSGYAPHEVQFTDLSSGQPTEWFWDFGDGETSDEQSPNHTYDVAGSYTVTLTVANDAGSNMLTKDDYIVVEWRPMDASFTATPESGTAPLTVQFDDQSVGNPTSWEWVFGDGGVSTLQNPEYTYMNPGTYTVTLTVFGPGGEDTQIMEDLVVVHHPLPVADFEADPTGGTAPLDVSFVNLSLNGSEYLWDFGDGNTSTEMNPDFVYDTPGMYTVTLTVTNPDGLTDEMVKEDYITVVPPAQVVITSFTGDPAGFISKQPLNGSFSQENGETASILSSSNNQYTVNFAAGTVTSTALTTAGEDILTLTVTGPTGSDTQELIVNIYEYHNLLADTITNQNIQIYTSPILATPEIIEYELLFPMQDFYNLYDFSFQANNQGAGIQEISFETNANTLSIQVQCNTTSNYQTFSILQNESGESWFQNGLLMLFPDEATLALLSEDISNFVNPGEDISTKIFTGSPTTWTITNETYNEVVYTGNHSTTGITEKTINVGSWTLGPILEQTLRIDISSPAKTISRYFPMDGTTGIIDFENEFGGDQLGKNYPNPFSDQTNIPIYISTPGNVKIELFDINGSIIRELLNEVKEAGNHLIKLEGAPIHPGVYLVKMTTHKHTFIRELIKF